MVQEVKRSMLCIVDVYMYSVHSKIVSLRSWKWWSPIAIHPELCDTILVTSPTVNAQKIESGTVFQSLNAWA